MHATKTGTDASFTLLGAIMILAMRAGFAFLELGTVRKKTKLNHFGKNLSRFCRLYRRLFFVGYSIAYGINCFADASALQAKSGFELVRFFFLLTFSAEIPAIIGGREYYRRDHLWIVEADSWYSTRSGTGF